MVAAEKLRPGDVFVSSRWNGAVYTRTVKAVSVSQVYGRREARVVTERGGVEHLPAGKLMEVVR